MNKAGDLEAERRVVAWYLVQRRAVVADSTLGSDVFAHGQHRAWWEAAKQAPAGWNAGDLGIDLDSRTSLAAIQSSPREIVACEKRITRSWQLRFVRGECRKLTESIDRLEVSTPDEAISEVRRILSDAESGGVCDARTHRETGIALFAAWNAAIREGRERGIPLPHHALRQRLGSLRSGKLYMVGAITSGHKTTFARMCAWYCAKVVGVPALFWSLEDTAEEVSARTIAAEVQEADTRTFTADRIPDGLGPGDFERLLQNLGEHLDDEASQRLRYLDEPQPRLSRVLSRISAEVARGARFVVLDFMQLIRPDGDQTQETQHWFDVSNALAAAAKRLDIPILATVQPTQAATRSHVQHQQPLTLGDLRGGSSIAQSAYGVLLINRVWDEEGRVDRRQVEVEIAKWKSAPPGKVRFDVTPHRDTLADSNRPMPEEYLGRGRRH